MRPRPSARSSPSTLVLTAHQDRRATGHTPNLTHAPTSGNTFRSPDQKDAITSSISHILPDYPCPSQAPSYPCHPHWIWYPTITSTKCSSLSISSSLRHTSNATTKPRMGTSNSHSPSPPFKHLRAHPTNAALTRTRVGNHATKSLHPGRDARLPRHTTHCSTHLRPSILVNTKHSREGYLYSGRDSRHITRRSALRTCVRPFWPTPDIRAKALSTLGETADAHAFHKVQDLVLFSFLWNICKAIIVRRQIMLWIHFLPQQIRRWENSTCPIGPHRAITCSCR
jgi:hypothetical protein